MKELTAIDRLLEQFADDSTDDQIEDALSQFAETTKVKESDKQTITSCIDFPERHRAQIELIGDEWTATYQKALQTANSCGIVALIGGRGTGKTQMAWQIAKNVKLQNVNTVNYDSGFSKQINRPAIYRTAMEIFVELRSTYAPKAEKTEWQLMKEYENAALLVIDEINVTTGNNFEDLKMTAIMDKRYQRLRPTILIGNVDLQQFSDRMGKSVINRIEEDGIIFSCNWPSYRTKKPL
jgi:DNA replication protein DnaC